ncbi:MAG: CRISPR-associated helicase Cas3' [Myxococcales bacterium]|nr:CRISPR-associated helicase Cas3' [Myxococcales bacterium]
MSLPPYLTQYWGKAQPRDPVGPAWQPLPYHSLDVAAVASVLLQTPSWRARLARLAGLPEDEAVAWAVFFIAGHDVGKICVGFQGVAPAVFKALRDQDPRYPYVPHHSVSGAVLWSQHLLGRLGVPARGRRHAAALPWVRAVTGHHGVPPATEGVEGKMLDQVDAATLADLIAWFDAQRALLAPSGPLPDHRHQPQSSWWLAGLTVLADWVGSDQAHFPYTAPARTLADYWEHVALPAAHQAVQALGLLSPAPRPFVDLVGLLPPEKRARVTALSPLQRLASTVDLPPGPTLAILEDRTGSGKTEAALALAARWLADGKGESLYVALPTMATANAMHARLAHLPDVLFAGEAHLQLAHGARRLVPLLRELARQAADEAYASEPAATAEGARWLSASTRRALLAHVGVGTIDQLLLAVLPVKYQSLRLLGASRAVLIVDEVHACDAYVHELLRAVLRFHAGLGGSAILLSATLPRDQRQALIAAFAEGLGVPNTAVLPREAPYPLATEVALAPGSSLQINQMPVEAHPGDRVVERLDVALAFAHDEEAVDAAIADALAEGACVCWIRNTVADAVAAFERWRPRHPATDLFHSRFLLKDRLDIEARVLAAFGETSTPADRHGRLLIATQVVEQSLDLDFDFMVTDLAPIDLVIQRAGRLHRHLRPGRGAPTLLVLSPAPTTAEATPADWYKALFPKAAYVYPRADQLWFTARALAHHGALRIPADARALVEAVYDPDDPPPAALVPASDETAGQQQAERALARHAARSLTAGYEADTRWAPDVHTPTRLGEDAWVVFVARALGPHLVPVVTAPGVDDALAWELSALRVSARILRDTGPAAPALLARLRPSLGRTEQPRVVVLEENNTIHAAGATYQYDATYGLRQKGEGS